ncbi:hypothetical protein EEB14_55480, partial [Rhodococcus sp. WS4]
MSRASAVTGGMIAASANSPAAVLSLHLDTYRSGVRDQLPPGLPPDPFAADPADPAAALDATEPGQPLDPRERLAVEEDLADLA